ncbi:M23 family metallopeptidase [Formosa sediminum]|uniref:M23 family metallopeptidase n=1 Tax=Formosa sediminum TaxID=2594004 RepID=A0A516GUF9_9FLAO|nr:peptidoglycan DD-metalloendopeptidase family protein [Formosa sediminum]QDO95157.1 M23 family metallopeptidase [Formosa sediminum]
MKQLIIILLTCITVASCKQARQITDAITKPSAKSVFERDLKDDSIVKHYEKHYSAAKNNGLILQIPALIQSKADTPLLKILAYTIDLQQGERLKIECNLPTDSLQLVMDLYSFTNDSTISKKPIASNTTASNIISYNVTNTGTYKIVVFPNTKNQTHFNLKLYTEPTLIFPVSGKGNTSIQSFWGATRSGGKRTHEGIDIFAARGTPVIAATDGFISNTGNRGLGGKQVWLRDGLFGSSLYYAHLDSIAVTRGRQVQTGDTLGFVGNTGNAITTSPHLHFGIYTSKGAINPLPFVKQTVLPEFKTDLLLSTSETRLSKNELRVSPNVKAEKIRDIKAKTAVQILGKTQSWFHLIVNDSLEGFMHESLIIQ